MSSVELEPAPEVMAFGPRQSRPWAVRTVFVGVIVAALVGIGVGVWTLVPKPGPPFTLSDLQGVYAGMVRSDGTNDLSTFDASNLTEEPQSITPAVCTPLFDTTVSNQFATDAQDGVSTYWLGEANTTVSLFTMRYADADTAAARFAVIDQAAQQCVGTEVTIRDRVAQVGRVDPTAMTKGDVKAELGYTFERSSGGRYAIVVFQLSNTITWQFRYDTSGRPYDPLTAQRLTDSLVAQMISVQDLKR